MVEPFPITEKNIPQEMVIDGILTSCFDKTVAKNLTNIPGLKFYNEDKNKDGEKIGFQTHKEFGKDPLVPKSEVKALTPESVSFVSIKVEGEDKPRYYKKIVQNEATTEKDISAIDNKTVNQSKNGFKGVAWMRTDEKGDPLRTEGKAEIRLSFPGYEGNPTDLKSKQTQYALAIEQGKLSPTVEDIPAFTDKLKAQLKEKGITNFDIKISGHSMGSANALAAAEACEAKGMPVASVLLIEPVGAALASHKLKEKFSADKNASERFDKIIGEKTLSVRAVEFDEKGKPHLSKSAMLEICSKENGISPEAMHKKNMGFLGNGLGGTISTGRDGNDPEKVDKNNKGVGKECFISMDGKKVKEKNVIPSLTAGIDPLHSLIHNVFSAPTAPMDFSIEGLKKKVEGQKSGAFKWNAEDIGDKALVYAASMPKIADGSEPQPVLKNPNHGLVGAIAKAPDISQGRT